MNLEGAEVRVRTCAGAAPFLHGGVPKLVALLGVDDELLLASSRLCVARRPELAPEAGPGEPETLPAGRFTEVRGFYSLVALGVAVDSAETEDELRAQVERWVSDHFFAQEVSVRVDPVRGGPAACHGVEILEDGERAKVTVCAPVRDGSWLTVSFVAEEPVGHDCPEMRLLLDVAGRVCALGLGRVKSVNAVHQDNAALRSLAIGSARAFLGNSPPARRVSELLPRLAATDATVLILGETGTGKSFVARLVHELGSRRNAPFRVLNCAAIPENLIESELFGHEKGAFTGAVHRRIGALEAAGTGTLFLDEIGEMPLASQAKLLRALEERRFERVGSNQTLTVRARVIAATNRDLAEANRQDRFRSDLYYRLSVVSLTVPSLRERKEDIPLLAGQILADLACASSRRLSGISEDALVAMSSYGWPGNVRELRNALERAVVLGDGPDLRVEDLPDAVRACTVEPLAGQDVHLVRLPMPLAELERRAIRVAVDVSGGNISKAAALLGVARGTVYKKMTCQSEFDPAGEPSRLPRSSRPASPCRGVPSGQRSPRETRRLGR